MGNILAVTLQAMQHDAAAVEQVAMNLANASTPGYKRAIHVQPPVQSGFARLIDSGTTSTSPSAIGSAPFLDIGAGVLKQTAQALDLALEGRGFFEVATPGGAAYTRHGAFQLDASGRLVTAQGYPVVGRAGEVRPGAASARVAPDGTVTDAHTGKSLAQLKLVVFEDEQKLERLGASLFASSQPGREPRVGEARVRQGFLENSNVNALSEMTRLMQAMRHFETMQRVTQGYDEMVGGAIRRLGEN